MEDKKLSERESIELISRMINQSASHLERGSGNPMLIWGYVCVAVSLLVYTCVSTTANPAYSMLYLLIPVLGLLGNVIYGRRSAKADGRAETFASFAIGRTWSTVGMIFFIAMLPCFFYMAVGAGGNSWFSLFVLGLLLPGIGVAVSGHLLKLRLLVVGGYVGIVLGVTVLCEGLTKTHVNIIWALVFAAAYVFIMVIPGHYINAKANAAGQGRK